MNGRSKATTIAEFAEFAAGESKPGSAFRFPEAWDTPTTPTHATPFGQCIHARRELLIIY
jgi:hypothetical protein